jgi:hypothetical protein
MVRERAREGQVVEVADHRGAPRRCAGGETNSGGRGVGLRRAEGSR